MPTFSRANLHLAGVYAALAAVLFFSFSSPAPGNPEFTPAPTIKAAADIPTEKIRVPAVVVLRKADVVKKITLPPSISTDPSKQISTTASIPPAPYGSEAIAVLDTTTGVTSILAHNLPRPLFGFKPERRIGIGYGVGSLGEPAAKVYAELGLLRIGSAHLGVQGVLQHGSFQGPSATAFVTLDYRF